MRHLRAHRMLGFFKVMGRSLDFGVFMRFAIQKKKQIELPFYDN